MKRPVLFGLVFALVACERDSQSILISTPTPPPPLEAVATQQQLKDRLRQLWTEHVLLTRVLIISVISNGPDQHTALERLLQNQADLGDAIRPFYGNDEGNRFTDLLRGYVFQTAEVLAAAKANDAAKAEMLEAQWFASAERIADFLVDASPTWLPAHVHQTMKVLSDLTLSQVTAQLAQDWAADVNAYDAVQDDVLMLADEMTAGIERQFPGKLSPDEVASDLHLSMRKLWLDHAGWTRVFIIDDVGNLPGAPAAKARLMKNQVELGLAIRGFYGAGAADQLTALLEQHVIQAASLLEALKTNDSDAQAQGVEAWHQNASQIADLLADANAHLDRAELRDLLKVYVDTTNEELSARVNGEYLRDVQAYDAVEQQALTLSDALSDAISEQFSTPSPVAVPP